MSGTAKQSVMVVVLCSGGRHLVQRIENVLAETPRPLERRVPDNESIDSLAASPARRSLMDRA
jgi:hypothetical protein